MNEYRKNEDDASYAIMTQEEPRSFAPLFSRKTMPAQRTVEGAQELHKIKQTWEYDYRIYQRLKVTRSCFIFIALWCAAFQSVSREIYDRIHLT